MPTRTAEKNRQTSRLLPWNATKKKSKKCRTHRWASNDTLKFKKSTPSPGWCIFQKKKINDLSLPFKKFVIHRCNRRLPHRQHRKNGRIKDTTRGLIHKESPSSNQNGGSPSFYFLKKLYLSLSIWNISINNALPPEGKASRYTFCACLA